MVAKRAMARARRDLDFMMGGCGCVAGVRIGADVAVVIQGKSTRILFE